jgi:putative copper export protein/mono/diheme cytochrome c family protein
MLNGALPAFGLDAPALALALSRAVAVGALFVVFGTLIMRVGIAGPLLTRADGTGAIVRHLARTLVIALATGAAATLVWLALQTAALADTEGAIATLAAIPSVLTGTEFGTLVILRLALLGLIALGCAGGRAWSRLLATMLAAGAVGLQAGHLHALAMVRGPSVLLASEALHVLAAAAWLGALPALLIIVAAAPAALAARIAARFSPVGVLAVLVIGATAAWQARALVGGFTGLLGTAYGWICLAKLSLFLVLLRLATKNRLTLLPRLARAPSAAARRAMLGSVALELALGTAVVMLAALLGTGAVPPGIHVQAIWPFPLRPSLEAVTGDPARVRAIAFSAVAMTGAVALAVRGLVWRRWRWPILGAAFLLAWPSAPPLGLLFVPAYPTSFYRSPSGFAADSITDGAALFATHCAACHGPQGRGDGPAGRGLAVAPADLTSPHLWMHSDGTLYWWLGAGIARSDGRLGMPGFGAALDDAARWELIDFIRANNAGVTHARTGRWSPPVPAPDFLADCGSNHALLLTELGPVPRRVVFLAPGEPAAPALPEAAPPVTTIMVPPDGRPRQPSARLCVASDPAIRTAYAIAIGQPESALDDMEVLIDANAWLRGFTARADAAAVMLRQIAAAPLPRQSIVIAHTHGP